MPSFELISNLAGVLLFFALLVLLLINWRGQLIGGLLIVATVTTILFFGCVAYNSGSGAISLSYIQCLEILRNFTWLLFLWTISRGKRDPQPSIIHKYLLPALTLGMVMQMFTGILISFEPGSFSGGRLFNIETLNFGFLILALIGLVLIEYLYRSTQNNYRWSIKYLCLGLGVIFLYDFYIYSDAVLFKRINPDLWFARGTINAICVPLIVVSIRRVKEWKMELFVSRHVVFQSSMILFAGLYLSFMAISGYYVRVFGGSWGGALQVVFIFAAILGLLIIIFSSDIRAQIKVFLAKHFYENKYDYRDEWLDFTRTLAGKKTGSEIYNNIVKAFVDTMNCTGGVMWLMDNYSKEFRVVTGVNNNQTIEVIPEKSELTQFLIRHEWIINLYDYQVNPGKYYNIEMPDPIKSQEKPVLIVPLFNEDNLLGLILLLKSDINIQYNWEDYDLLKTMGRQAASIIALVKANEELMESKQFEAFNRLSAFVVHDMKNITAQLSLIHSNSKKYKDNPDFLNDTFETINNAVARMKRLTKNLNKDALSDEQNMERVEVSRLIDEVATLYNYKEPIPIISESEKHLFILANKDKLVSVIEHLVQNAQDASSTTSGKIEIRLNKIEDFAEIKIIDNGCGMDGEFINNRLFKPFDTTKGNAGMGIGVYESREVIQSLGGMLKVESVPGEGTTFTIDLPLVKNANMTGNDNVLKEAL